MPTVYFIIVETSWTQVAVTTDKNVNGEVQPGKTVRLHKGLEMPSTLASKAFSRVISRRLKRGKFAITGNTENVYLRSEDGHGAVEVVVVT